MDILQIDAFASEPFSGNPAAVCLLDDGRDESWMQSVAAEMNLSETAFVAKQGTGSGDRAQYEIRWFTPQVEVDLCGHATLASAHALWTTGRVAPSDPIRFVSPRSGELRASRRGGLIELDFPVRETRSVQPPDVLLEALGVMPRFVGRTQESDLLVEVDDEATLREIAPDFQLLQSVEARGIAVTARGDEHDFVSRFFAPAVGIDEDPVTGSAHCALGPYWQPRLKQTVMQARQISERGGSLEVEVTSDRVLLRGRAVTVLEGRLRA